MDTLIQKANVDLHYRKAAFVLPDKVFTPTPPTGVASNSDYAFKTYVGTRTYTRKGNQLFVETEVRNSDGEVIQSSTFPVRGFHWASR